MNGSSTLSELDLKRSQLEGNIAKLRASLRHWQQWEIEYEGMKEDLARLGHRRSRRDLQDLEKDRDDGLFTETDGNLLNTKERRDLLYDKAGKLRKPETISGLLSRRVDYVQSNVKSVTALLSAAEDDLNKINSAAIEAQADDKEEPALTDIVEMLDDDDNVVSSSVTHPSQNTADLAESLRKVGIHDIHSEQPKVDQEMEPEISPVLDTDNPTTSTESQSADSEGQDRDMWTSDPATSDAEPTKRRRPRTRKRVSFAEGTKAEHDPSEHPSQLPKEERDQILRSAGNQLRQTLGKSIVAGRSDLFGGQGPTFQASEIDFASQILRLQQHRDAKRLLKACELDLQGAAEVLRRMAETENYDLESPQIASLIAEMRELRSNASSSRESSPGAFASPLLNGNAVSAALARQRETSVPNSEAKQLNSNSSGDGPADLAEDHGTAMIISDETEEDAALRRQMLQYNMREFGAIVAELEVDDSPDDSGDGDIDDDDDDDVDMALDDGDGDDEDEDEHGRTVSQVLGGDYIAEMRALEEKLQAKAMVNAGPERKNSISSDTVINGRVNDKKSKKQSPKSKSAKGVRFAADLDIHEVPNHAQLTESVIQDTQPSETNGDAPNNFAKPKKRSLFKSNRVAQRDGGDLEVGNEPSVPSAPSTQPPLTSRPIIEREAPMNGSMPTEPTEYDPILMQSQVRDEYHRLRNRMIANEGGFLRQEEPDEVPIEAEEGGRKVSRFKAARLGVH